MAVAMISVFETVLVVPVRLFGCLGSSISFTMIDLDSVSEDQDG